MATDLQELIGDRTYKAVAALIHVSEPTISQACRGARRPTWEITRGIVQACGEDPEKWRTRWEAADTAYSRRDEPGKRQALTSGATEPHESDRSGLAQDATLAASPPAENSPTTAALGHRSPLALAAVTGLAVAMTMLSAAAPPMSSPTSTGIAVPGCDDIGVGADSRWTAPFRAAYTRAGGRDELGCPTPDQYGYVHEWKPGYSQDLRGGRAVNSRIMALDEHRVVVMAGRYFHDYTDFFTNTAADKQGYPTSDPIPCGPAQLVLLEGSRHSPGAMVTSPDGRFVWLRREAWYLYRTHGGPQGPLGRPTRTLGDQLDGTITFEHGSITLSGNNAHLTPGLPPSPMTCLDP
ncbi:helix-turn-helix domain-containing protein [Actinosynnema sp. NPDC059335]|uniref:helix-turn-helix domain-containing protein n=1 Tax=Actinosynnema sp. NPDC059335 TaxID=3346804 RepID=UPI00366EBD3B